jgi:hypothetical protein
MKVTAFWDTASCSFEEWQSTSTKLHSQIHPKTVVFSVKCARTHLNSECRSSQVGKQWYNESIVATGHYTMTLSPLWTRECKIISVPTRLIRKRLRPIGISQNPISTSSTVFYSRGYFLWAAPVIRNFPFREFIMGFLLTRSSSFTFRPYLLFTFPWPCFPQSAR